MTPDCPRCENPLTVLRWSREYECEYCGWSGSDIRDYEPDEDTEDAA